MTSGGVLSGWVRRPKTAQALSERARIVLACADGGSIGAVAGELGVSRKTVSRWRGRFLAARLEGLSDEPRPGWPRTVTDGKVEPVITKTLEEQGPGEDTALPPAPAPGIHPAPQAHRRRRAQRPRPAPGPGQLRHPQDPQSTEMARIGIQLCWLLRSPMSLALPVPTEPG